MRNTTKTLVVLVTVLLLAPQMLSAVETSAATVSALGMGDAQAVCPPGSKLTAKEQLGKSIFFDKNLSEPSGQSCGSCHDPSFGFTDPDKILPVSEGVILGRVGNRNAPTTTYQGTAPDFEVQDPPPPAVPPFFGGQFWDGRALNLVEQAKAPFLNILEMNNPSKYTVIRDVAKASYASQFKKIYGKNVFKDVEYAYDCVADAIAAYEKSPELNKFNSKFDLVRAGKATFTPLEQQGFEIFSDFDFTTGRPGRANCNTCHSLFPDPGGAEPPFTDRRYFNVGVPKNMSNPFYFLPPELNPDRRQFVDIGLGGILSNPAADGAVKVPTLRNIAKTSPYMHNGNFQRLETVVHFYNTRDVPGAGWGPPEFADNVVGFIIGNQGLSEEEEDAIVAFLKTLTDDYKAK